MEDKMKLDQDEKLFSEGIRATSAYYHIDEIYIEKDYWICKLLEQLSVCKDSNSIVFKGGTSLSKGYNLISRFSEDIDLAVLTGEMNGNQIKTLLKRVCSQMTNGLNEVNVQGVTSKGSHYRKSFYEFPKVNPKASANSVISNYIVVEINSFGNPYPFEKRVIKSFVTQYMESMGMDEYIEQYEQKAFSLNVLDKRQTLCEKIVSLIRFSHAEDPIKGLAGKIRHFYDLYYLLEDPECQEYVITGLIKDIKALIKHDQMIFDVPPGWKNYSPENVKLFTSFRDLWSDLGGIYEKELGLLAYHPIPSSKDIEEKFIDFAVFLKTELMQN